MSCRRALADQSGFTLVEVMVAVIILLAGVLGTLTLLDGANAATSRTKAREAATNLARELIESARAVPYTDLGTPQIVPAIQQQPGLGDANAASGWQLRRRNVLFTVTPTACSVDDTTTSSATTPAATSAPTRAPRTRRIRTRTTTGGSRLTSPGRDGSTTRKVRQEAVINNPGRR